MTKTILSSAPGRCGIIGNPTDIYGGSVISIATAERARCRITPAETLRLVAGEQSSQPDSPAGLDQQSDHLDIARAVLRHLSLDPVQCNFELEMSTDIPMQAGMAGSTALVVATLGAVLKWYDLDWHPWRIAEEARKIEARIMKVFCGLQDQHMAVFGGLNYMDFAGKQNLEQSDEEPLATIEPLLGQTSLPPLLAAHTGVQHHSGTVHKSPRERWLAGDAEVVDAYKEIAKLSKLGKRALLEKDWPRLGTLMNENHAVTKQLGGSGSDNERLIEAARAAGAYGAKLAGAGGGGTILVLTDRPDTLRDALSEAGADGFYVPSGGPGIQVRANP